MMRVVVVVVLVLFSVGANAFSASSNRVFVGTPVSNFPKHLGKRESQREEEKYTPLERYRVMFLVPWIRTIDTCQEKISLAHIPLYR
jgi:hypothetical protein